MVGVLFMLPSPVPQHLLRFGVGSSRAGGSRAVVVLNAGFGRSSGGIHGHRGKGRRRRLRKPDAQDDLHMPEEQPTTTSEEEDENAEADESSRGSRAGRGRKMRRRSSKLEEIQQELLQQQNEEASTIGEVAPVASTVLTAPDLFPNSSEEADAADTTSTSSTAEEVTAEVISSGPDNEQDGSALAEQVAQIGQTVLPEALAVQAGQVAEQVSHVAEAIVEQIATPVVEQVTNAAVQVANLLTHDQEQKDEENQSDDEFEAYTTSDLPEFRGISGLKNFQVLQEKSNVLTFVYDVYLFMLKQPLPNFALAMFAAPIAISGFFTLLYLPQLEGLALEDTARQYVVPQGPQQLSWAMVFEVFMFSLSLSTGLEPELAPLTPYTLLVANVNALFAQLIFVFLSGAVFARLSQPSQPIRFSPVALISPPPTKKKTKSSQSAHRVFMTRYVLVGPQPCELVDVKVDLCYKYNTMTRTGSYFRATESLKLVRSEVAYVDHGMYVRHIIDDTSPLKRRTTDMMRKEDGIFTLSVVGLERSSMQSVFHAQHYSVYDDHVIWDAEFEDMILINKKNRRIVDHSRLSLWRHVR